MYVLDNDTTRHFFAGSNASVVDRVLAAPRRSIFLPIIVVQEQLKGRLGVIAQLNASNASDNAKLPFAYKLLTKTIEDLAEFPVLPYTEEAARLFQSWPPAVKRAGTHDCLIAAIAVSGGFTVVTCNTRHFESIPDILLEDWSITG